MSTDLPDPTPVTGQLELSGYRAPRLRITATYDSEGTSRPTSLDIEVHDDETPSPDVIRQVVSDVVTVLSRLGKDASVPPQETAGTGGGHIQWIHAEGGAAA